MKEKWTSQRGVAAAFWITACGRRYEWVDQGESRANQVAAEAHYARHAKRCAKCKKSDAKHKRETEKLRKAGKLFDSVAYEKSISARPDTETT